MHGTGYARVGRTVVKGERDGPQAAAARMKALNLGIESSRLKILHLLEVLSREAKLGRTLSIIHTTW